MLKKMIEKDSKENNNEADQEDRPFKSFINASTIGMAFVSSIFIGTAMGYFLDKYFGTQPYLLFFFMIMGIIAGFRNAFYFLKRTGLWNENRK